MIPYSYGARSKQDLTNFVENNLACGDPQRREQAWQMVGDIQRQYGLPTEPDHRLDGMQLDPRLAAGIYQHQQDEIGAVRKRAIPSSLKSALTNWLRQNPGGTIDGFTKWAQAQPELKDFTPQQFSDLAGYAAHFPAPEKPMTAAEEALCLYAKGTGGVVSVPVNAAATLLQLDSYPYGVVSPWTGTLLQRGAQSLRETGDFLEKGGPQGQRGDSLVQSPTQAVLGSVVPDVAEGLTQWWLGNELAGPTEALVTKVAEALPFAPKVAAVVTDRLGPQAANVIGKAATRVAASPAGTILSGEEMTPGNFAKDAGWSVVSGWGHDQWGHGESREPMQARPAPVPTEALPSPACVEEAPAPASGRALPAPKQMEALPAPRPVVAGGEQVGPLLRPSPGAPVPAQFAIVPAPQAPLVLRDIGPLALRGSDSLLPAFRARLQGRSDAPVAPQFSIVPMDDPVLVPWYWRGQDGP